MACVRARACLRAHISSSSTARIKKSITYNGINAKNKPKPLLQIIKKPKIIFFGLVMI